METQRDIYTQLIALLDQHQATYRFIDHAPQGQTELVSAMRGNALSQAAKCIVLMVKQGKKVTKYILAVVPGDARVDLQAVKALLQGTYVAFASSAIAEQLAGSVAGTILPFSFHAELELIVDPSLLENDELYFNAARLDRSMVLKTSDYVAIAKPRLASIAASQEISPEREESMMEQQIPYSINLNAQYKPLELIDVPALVASCQAAWYNQTLCQVNESVVRLGIMQGAFHWHKHEKEDEFFFVLEGRFLIDLEGRTVELAPQQGFTIPKGVIHRTRAPERTVILMIESVGIVPTGD